MREIYILILLTFVQTQYIHSQTRDRSKEKDTSYIMIKNVYYHKDSINFLYDPLDVGFQQIRANDNAFLVTDTIYYNFLIDDVRNLKKGYFISAYTKIQDSLVYVQIISLKERMFYKNKIKKGDLYPMKLIRYSEMPLHRSIEYKAIYDVMVGEKSVGVLSTGWSYLFITQNLRGLEYLDSASISHIETDIKKIEEKLYIFLYQVIKSLSFKEDSSLLVNYFDTFQVKKSFKYYNKKFMYFSPNLEEQPIYPPKKVEKNNWQIHDIKTNNFYSWFWGIINYFYLSQIPINRENKEIDFDDFAIKVLDFHDELYTVRVRWRTYSQKQSIPSYYAVFIVKKQEDTFKIVGFNKPIFP